MKPSAQAAPGPDAMMSAEMAAVLRDLPAPGSAFAELDRELLALVDGLAGPEERSRLAGLMSPLTEPAALAWGHALYRRLDELAGASPGDLRVAPLAADLAAHIPDEMAALMLANLDTPPERAFPPGPGPDAAGNRDASESRGGGGDGGRWLEAMSTEMSPAQAEVLRLVMITLQARA
ncbi:hypothetical protein [Sphaerisporangium perillae]|uniref:hypothetical protein n=1 Tax=Sphaerisporangium perillae TaxID=2935860 RepID=UPI00200DC1E3|nr:hypothetical protein [Sphaerisporangium perillae]